MNIDYKDFFYLAEKNGFDKLEANIIEPMYQAFKARLIDELKADVQGVYSQADLVEKE